MHSAPSVSYPVGRSRFAGLLSLAAWVLGALAIAWWQVQAQAPSWRQWMAWSVLAGAGAFAAWAWARSPRGVLAWDGATWSWTEGQDVQAGTLEVGLDLQRWLLLRFCGSDSSHWCWLARTSLPERWDDVRRAVYSRARPEALPQVRASAPKP